MPLSEEEKNELLHELLRRLADRLYEVPDQALSDYQRDRYFHIDLAGWSVGDLERDLELVRIRRRIVDHPWLDEREVALVDRVAARRRRSTTPKEPRTPRRAAPPRPRRRK